MKCNICNSRSKLLFKKTILDKYVVRYYQCAKCELIQTESPFWLDESYASAININDTGILSRNYLFRNMISPLLYLLIGKDKIFLDYAGGYGIFTRLMRDLGYNYFWTDPKCENLLARGFEWDGNHVDCSTAIEVFEHFTDPIGEIKKLMNISETIVFTTELQQDIGVKDGKWWYFCFEHGQHVSLYSHLTLKTIAEILQCNLYSDKNRFHILTKNKLPIGSFSFIRYGYKILAPIIASQLKSKTFLDYLKLS